MQKLLVLLNNWRSWSVIRSKIGSWQWLNIVKPSSKMFNQPTSGISPWFSSLTSVPRPYWRLTWLQAPFFPLPGAGRREIYYQPFYIWFTWFTHTAFFCSQVLQSQKKKKKTHFFSNAPEKTTPQARWRAWQTSASLLPGHRRCMAYNNAAPQPLPKPLPQAALQQRKWSLHSWPRENGGAWNWGKGHDVHEG